MKWLILLLACAFSASAKVSVAFVPPKLAEHILALPNIYPVAAVKPLGAVHMIVFKAASTITPTVTLTWDYPTDQITNVVFELYHAISLSCCDPPLAHYDSVPYDFMLLTTVDAPPVTTPKLANEFFIVRARDRQSGGYSYWNQ